MPVRIQGKENTYLLLVGVKTGTVAIMEKKKSMLKFLRKLRINLPQDPDILLLDI